MSDKPKDTGNNNAADQKEVQVEHVQNPTATNTDSGKEQLKGEWNSRLEEAALDIGHAAQGYKHMHIIEAQKANKRHTWLMGTGIIMGPLASVLSSVGLALNLEADPGIAISVIVMGFLSGIVVAAVKFGKYDEVSSANKSAAARYTSIEANVRRQLGLYRKDRIPAIAYMDWLETKYEELLLSAPLISARTHTRYVKQAQRQGLPTPDHYDRNISINTSRTRDTIDSSHIQVKVTQEEQDDTDNEDIGILQDKVKRTTKKPPSRMIVRRASAMATIPQLNQCSDKMLQYEMQRLMGMR
jgi:hypothetical protein